VRAHDARAVPDHAQREPGGEIRNEAAERAALLPRLVLPDDPVVLEVVEDGQRRGDLELVLEQRERRDVETENDRDK
jgi:hypothetical protein